MESGKKAEYIHEIQLRDKGLEKNILFVSPHLSSKDFYRMIVPYFGMIDRAGSIGTAITDFRKYNPTAHLLEADYEIPDNMLWWATHVVFPFSTNDLTGIYKRIREVNNMIKIVYLVDFNFYLLPQTHPYYSIINGEGCIDRIENNMLFADLNLTANAEFRTFLHKKLMEKCQANPNLRVQTYIRTLPLIIDTELMLENIHHPDDYQPQKPEHIVHRKHAKDVITIAAKVKEEMPKKSVRRPSRRAVMRKPKKHIKGQKKPVIKVQVTSKNRRKK